MFRSIFLKYFSIVSLVVCLSILALAGVQTFVSARYWMNEKEALLTENAEKVAKSAAGLFRPAREDESRYAVPSDRENTLPVMVDFLADTLDADVMIADNRGELVTSATTRPGGRNQEHVRISEDILKKVDKKNTYFSVGTLADMYEDRQYIAVAAIEKNDRVLGYVLLVAPSDDMANYLWQNVRTILMSAVFVLLLSTIAVYVFTYRLAMPLRKMAAAAKAFGAGDFSYRLSVKGKDEVAQLAKELNSMAESLSREEEMSRSFIANVSHELRTPMTTISGFVDGMRDGTIPPEKHEFYLSIVSDEVRRLSRLVQAMLNLSRIDNQSLKVRPSTFDLTALTGKTLLSFEQRVEEKQLRITGFEECENVSVVADEDLIGQVVYNLIDNAVKFTNTGGEISFSIRSQEDRVLFSISNTGEGIPVEELPYVFERFYKSDRSRGLDKTGAGLGLFLVKSIIGLHGGEIAVRSLERESCTFEFWLPGRKNTEI